MLTIFCKDRGGIEENIESQISISLDSKGWLCELSKESSGDLYIFLLKVG